MKHTFTLWMLAVLSTSAVRAEESRPVLEQEQKREIEKVLSESETVEAARTAWLSRFVAADVDGRPGLSEADFALSAQVFAARGRADFLVSLLRADLNGDLSLTRADVLPFARSRAATPIRVGTTRIAPTETQLTEITELNVAQMLAADVSGDGAVVLTEMLDGAVNRKGQFPSYKSPVRFALLLDKDGDGTVTEAEFLSAFETAAAAFDTNGDGLLSQIERAVGSDRPVPRTARQKQDRRVLDTLLPKPLCNLAPLNSDTQVLVIGGYEGAALSTVTLGGPQSVTYVVDLNIPDGKRPIALIIGFSVPVIIRISGAADRIQEARTLGPPFGLVGRSDRPLKRAGSVQGKCDYDFWRGQPAKETAETVRVWTGTSDAIVATGYTIGTVTLRSQRADVSEEIAGGINPRFTPTAKAVWEEMVRYNPGGLIDIDIDTVKSPGYAVAVADPWPQEAGLAQLVESGALTPIGDRSVRDMRTADQNGAVTIGSKRIRWSGGDDVVRVDTLNYTMEEPGRWIGREPPLYRINRAITLLAGLYGAHMAEFLLPRGVPEPKGDRAHTRLRPGDE